MRQREVACYSLVIIRFWKFAVDLGAINIVAFVGWQLVFTRARRVIYFCCARDKAPVVADVAKPVYYKHYYTIELSSHMSKRKRRIGRYRGCKILKVVRASTLGHML